MNDLTEKLTTLCSEEKFQSLIEILNQLDDKNKFVSEIERIGTPYSLIVLSEIFEEGITFEQDIDKAIGYQKKSLKWAISQS